MHCTTLRLRLPAIALFAVMVGVAAAQTNASAPAHKAGDSKQAPAATTKAAAPAAQGADGKSSPAPASNAADSKKSAADAAKEKQKQNASSVADLQQQLTRQRDQLIAEHAALAKQLKDATDAQKKEILERMEEQKKAAEERMSALHKQMIEERRRERAGRSKR